MAENASAVGGFARLRGMFGSEERLSWLLAGLAGVVGAIALVHSSDYFVTTTTGNSQRAVVGFFRDDIWLSVSAAMLVACFVAGVFVASLCRRYFWVAHPHGPTVLTTVALGAAAVVDVVFSGWDIDEVSFLPILLAAFGMGALNTAFVKDGQVSIAVSYVTGTLVKLGQGIERHLNGGSFADWLGPFVLWASFMFGSTIGGCISLFANGPEMLVSASLVCALTSVYTYFHADRRALRKAAREQGSEQAAAPNAPVEAKCCSASS